MADLGINMVILRILLAVIVAVGMSRAQTPTATSPGKEKIERQMAIDSSIYKVSHLLVDLSWC